MTRKKVTLTLAYIANDLERKASYKKRKKGLIKKVEELTTLCGVEACAIIYSPYEPEPTVWPSPTEAHNVLNRFNNMSLVDRTRKMVNQEGFTRHRIKKAEGKIRRLQKENKRTELEIFMHQCITGKANIQQFNINDSAEMNLVINNSLREINERMEALKLAAGQHQRADASALESGTQPYLTALPPPQDPIDGFAWGLTMDSPKISGIGYEHMRDWYEWGDNTFQPNYPYLQDNLDHASTSENHKPNES